MATKMNENGVSTCKTGEKYEKFQMTVGRKRRTFYHYDYRDTADNELFSCVKPTLEECRRQCNEWLKRKRTRNNTGTKLPLPEWKPVRGAILLDFHQFLYSALSLLFFGVYPA